MDEAGSTQAGLDEVVSRIGTASQALNDAAERATQIIEALDEKLTEADPGVTVWTEVLASDKALYQRESAAPEVAQHQVTLGFGRIKKKKWGICVKEEIKGKKGVTLEEDVTLLRKADRDFRLLALPHLESLARAILAELEGRAERVGPLLAESEPDGREEASPAAVRPPATEPEEASASPA